MKRIVGTVAFAVLLSASPAAAQTAEIEDAVERSGLIDAVEELAAALEPEVERIADSLGRLALRVSEDPGLRRTALRAALGAVEVAEVMVIQHSEIVRDALRDAAAQLERMAEEMRRS